MLSRSTFYRTASSLVFEPILNEFTGNISNSKCIWEQIVVLIDSSGSTNNSNNKNRVNKMERKRSGFLEDIENQDIVNTKPIIIAEEEGISHILVFLANTYNMTNVKFILANFDDDCHIARNITLTLSQELYLYASELDKLMNKNFTSTNLTKAINTVLEDCTKNTLLIIASDGRPDSPISVLDELDIVVDKFKRFNKTLDIFTVGAGSIQECENGRVNSNSCRGSRNTNLDNSSAIKILGNGLECDKVFLEYISEKSTRCGGYAGAYDNYSDLMNGFVNFISQIVSYDTMFDNTWYVILDDSLVRLQDECQIIMKKLKFSGRDYGLVNSTRGYYLLAYGNGTQPYQIHLEQINNYNSTIMYVPDSECTLCFLENIELVHKTFFDDYCSVSKVPTSYALNVVIVAISKDGSKSYFKPDTVKLGKHYVFKVRELKCV
jgi:hypothetical protein